MHHTHNLNINLFQIFAKISKLSIKKLLLQIRYVCHNRNLSTHLKISLVKLVIRKTEKNS